MPNTQYVRLYIEPDILTSDPCTLGKPAHSAAAACRVATALT